MRIEICGGIGAGKTTLANLIKKRDIFPVIENFKSNPFWEPFYSNPNKYQFETELTFLLQHYHAVKAIQNESYLVCDFSLYQDLAYAKMGLDGHKLKIFELVFNEVLHELGQPDLLVYLTCLSDTLKERIERRGRSEEKSISCAFLDSLNKHIYHDVHHFDSNRILYLNSESYDFANDPVVQNEITNLIIDKISVLN